MSKKIKPIFYKREFLNRDQGIAYIEASVSAGDFRTGIEAHIQLADCNRSVHLDFSVYDQYSKKQRLAKLKKIITALQAMEKAIQDYKE